MWAHQVSLTTSTTAMATEARSLLSPTLWGFRHRSSTDWCAFSFSQQVISPSKRLPPHPTQVFSEIAGAFLFTKTFLCAPMNFQTSSGIQDRSLSSISFTRSFTHSLLFIQTTRCFTHTDEKKICVCVCVFFFYSNKLFICKSIRMCLQNLVIPWC